MPFSGPSSYLPTIDEFVQHWLDVNNALGLSGPIVLPGPYNQASLVTDRASMLTRINDLVVAINAVEGLGTDRDNRKAAIKERMRQLGAFIRGVLAGSVYVGEIPPLIAIDANPGLWIISIRDYRDMWTRINATPPVGFTPPLLLTGSYAVATFITDTAALETTFQSLAAGENNVNEALKQREALYHAIRDHLVLYREAVPGRFPADHPLVLSLPRLTPLPGHTPDPVVLSGSWNAGTVHADFTWTASVDPDLDHYQLRREGSPTYNGNLEQVVASYPPGTLAASTNAGLTLPGSTMGFKMYVVLNTGNESGSNAVTVVRP